MLIDSFIFHQEVDLLRLRLLSGAQKFKCFVICESTKTFTGIPREPILEKIIANDSRFDFLRETNSSIKLLIYDPEVPPQDPWMFERAQRDYMGAFISEKFAGDIVFNSDLDEIPSPSTIDRALMVLQKDPQRIIPLTLWMIMFRVNFVKMWGPETESRGPFFYVPQNHQLSLMDLRDRAKKIAFENPVKGFRLAGWHLTYIGDSKFIERKLRSFSHQEDAVQRADFDVVRHFINGTTPFDEKGKAFSAVLPLQLLNFPDIWFEDSWFLKYSLSPTTEYSSLDSVIIELNDQRKRAKKSTYKFKKFWRADRLPF